MFFNKVTAIPTRPHVLIVPSIFKPPRWGCNDRCWIIWRPCLTDVIVWEDIPGMRNRRQRLWDKKTEGIRGNVRRLVCLIAVGMDTGGECKAAQSRASKQQPAYLRGGLVTVVFSRAGVLREAGGSPWSPTFVLGEDSKEGRNTLAPRSWSEHETMFTTRK